MLTAYANFEPRPGFASLLNSPAHKHADAFGIERLEGVRAENTGLFLVHVIRQKATGIVAGKAHRRLGEIVGAKGEEFRNFGDFSSQQSRPRKLDHCADQIVQLDAGIFDQLVGHSACRLLQNPELLSVQRQRVHDLR